MNNFDGIIKNYYIVLLYSSCLAVRGVFKVLVANGIANSMSHRGICKMQKLPLRLF